MDVLFENPMTAAAAIDRFVHHSVILEFDVPSFRTENAKKAKASGAQLKKSAARSRDLAPKTQPGTRRGR